jgi:hypothetical protein
VQFFMCGIAFCFHEMCRAARKPSRGQSLLSGGRRLGARRGSQFSGTAPRARPWSCWPSPARSAPPGAAAKR